MIRKSNEKTVERHERRFGGPGFITLRKLIETPDELNGFGRGFTHITLEPGSGIGWHVHEGDSEIYYILKGRAAYDDNGVKTEIGAGDVTFTRAGEGHSLTCIGPEPVEMIALILYDARA